jgi:hypothetical protein
MRHEPHECHAQSGLAGPGGTGKTYHFAVVDGEGNTIERRLGRVAIAEPDVA